MSLKRTAAIATGMVAIVVGLAAIGIDLPKVATQAFVETAALPHLKDYDILVGEVKSAKELSLENAIAREELRAGNLEIQAAQLKAAGADSSIMEGLAKDLRKSVAKRERELLKLED